jgi:hypothetical protein
MWNQAVPAAHCELCHGDRHHGQDLQGSSKWSLGKGVQRKPGGNLEEAVNRKATIVIEHLIQLPRSHTMQHWHIYRSGMSVSFENCTRHTWKVETDPGIWYKGEIGFSISTSSLGEEAQGLVVCLCRLNT